MRLWILLPALAALAVDGLAADLYAPLPVTYLSSLDVATKSFSLIRPGPDSFIQLAAGPDNMIFLATDYPGIVDAYTPETGAFQRFKTTYPAVGYDGLAVSPDGSLVFVATCAQFVQEECYENYLEEIEVSSGAEVGIVSFGLSEIGGITTSPSGDYLYVGDSYYDDCCEPGSPRPNPPASVALSGLTAFSVPSLTPVASLESIGAPTIDPTGAFGYVAGTGNELWILGLPRLQVEKKVSIPGGVGELALSRNAAILCSLQSNIDHQFPFNVAAYPTSLTCFSAPGLAVIGTVALSNNSSFGLVLNGDGSMAYNATQWGGVITGIDTSTMTVSEALPAGAPSFFVPNSSGTAFYISQADQSVLGVFPEGGLHASRLLPVSSANSLSLSPGGGVLYISQFSGLNSYSTKDGELLKTYLQNVYVGAAVPIADGSKLLAAGIEVSSAVSNVYILDPISGATERTTPIPSPTAGPFSVSLAAQGTKACIAPHGLNGGGPVQIYDLKLNTFLAVGAEETENCVIDPSGTFVYVTDIGGGIDVFDAANGSQIGTIPDVSFPVVFSPISQVAYAISENGTTVMGTAVIDTSTNTVITTISASDSAYYAYMAITSDGAYLYEAPKDYSDEKTGSGVVIDTATQQVVGSIFATGPMVAN
jgi:hypothetical protein